MKDAMARWAWVALVVVTVGGALISLPPPPTSSAGGTECNQSAPVCFGDCFLNNTTCYGNQPNATACSCVPTGCCRLNATTCDEQVAEPACLNSTFVAGGSCAVDCALPTPTPKIPDGGGCLDPLDCLSGNCVNDVCCDTACDAPEQSCNVAGSVGTCTSVAAPAPAASHGGLLLSLALLLGVGGLAMWRRRFGQT